MPNTITVNGKNLQEITLDDYNNLQEQGKIKQLFKSVSVGVHKKYEEPYKNIEEALDSEDFEGKIPKNANAYVRTEGGYTMAGFRGLFGKEVQERLRRRDAIKILGEPIPSNPFLYRAYHHKLTRVEERMEKAKKLIIATIVGIVIIYGSFALVSTVISGKLGDAGALIN